MNHYRRTVFHCDPVPVSQNCLGKKMKEEESKEISFCQFENSSRGIFVYIKGAEHLQKCHGAKMRKDSPKKESVICIRDLP